MTEHTNELQLAGTAQPQVFNPTTGEKIVFEQIVQDTPDFQIVIGSDGKPKKKMKYHKRWTYIPETDEELEQIFLIVNDSDNELVTPLAECNKLEFAIEHVLFNPYESFNDETFSNDFGVTSTLLGTDGKWYATSSKVAYYQLKNMFDTFGYPDEINYRPIKVQVELKKEEKGKSTNLRFKGRVK